MGILEGTPRSAWTGYAIAIAISGLLSLVSYLLWQSLGWVPPLIIFLVAVVISSWLGGNGPGVLASFLVSPLAIYFLIVRPLAIYSTPSKLVTFVSYVIVATLVILLAASLRKAAAKLRESLRALAKSEREFRSIFELSAVGEDQVDPLTGRFLRVNNKLCEITGYSEAELLSMTYGDLTHPDDRDADHLRFLMAVQGLSKTYFNEKRYIRKDGRIIWVAVNSTIIHDDKGNPTSSYSIIIDITAKRQAEELLRESEARYREIAENIEHVFWVLDQEKIIYINPAYEKVWGRSLSSLYTNFRSYSDAVHAEDRPRVLQAFAGLRRGERFSTEYRVVHPDGSIRWVHDRGFPLQNETGNPYRAVGIAEDITTRKRTEAQLAAAKEEAENANREKSAFLAAMSHEIRTPLSAIIGFTELLLGPEVRVDERVKYATIIQRNGQLLRRLIDDILDLSKVEAGKLEIEKLKVSLPELLSDVMATLAKTARDKDIALLAQSEGEVPEQIMTDSLRLRQILVNVIGNAIKFTAKGSVTITLKANSQKRGLGRQIEFTVRDTGKGIAREDQERLFQPFTQVGTGTARMHGGTGLGLTLSKRLAQALGGDLKLKESILNQGSTFIISIDTGPSVNSPILKGLRLTDECPEGVPRANSQSHLLDGINILLIGDDRDSQPLLKNLPDQHGGQIDFVDSAVKGIEMALNKNYDLVLIGIQLPDLDGYEATARLRHYGYQKPIIALTTEVRSESREKSLQAGCNDQLIKPINQNTLIHLVERYAKRTR